MNFSKFPPLVDQCLTALSFYLFLQLLLNLLMNWIRRKFKSEHTSVAHVHLVYADVLTQITNMCEIFNLGVPDRGEEPLHSLVRKAIMDEEARISSNVAEEDYAEDGDVSLDAHNEDGVDESQEAERNLIDEECYTINATDFMVRRKKNRNILVLLSLAINYVNIFLMRVTL